MTAFYTAIAVAAVCGLVLGLLVAGSWLGVYQSLRLSIGLGGVLFVLACVGVAAILERRNGRRRRGSGRDDPPR